MNNYTGIPASSAPVTARYLGQLENTDSPAARLGSQKEGDVIKVKVRRCDPGNINVRHEVFEVPYTPYMRVLDVLNYATEHLGADFAYRWYCGTKKCGTCAVRVNGRELLACWEPAEKDMLIEPLRHVPTVRDLVVDRAPYEEKVSKLQPWLQRREAYGGFPEKLTDATLGNALKAMDCLSCMVCYSACPVLDFENDIPFSGPAPLVQMAKTALDQRDGNQDRARLLLEEAHIFECVSCYKCEQACPVGIPIVSGIIEPLKAIAHRGGLVKRSHAQSFIEIVAKRGRIEPSLLIFKTRGVRGALREIPWVLRLWWHGKISPFRMLFGRPITGYESIRRLFSKLGRL